MSQMTMTVEKREQTGKSYSGRLRREGKIPGVLYGDAKPPVALVLEPAAIEKVLQSERGANTIFDLELAGAGMRRPAMIHEIQRHPVSQKLVHADFVRINLKNTVTVHVAISLDGTPKGVKLEGGIVEFPHREVSIECLPSDIPDEIVIDISEFAVGDMVKVADLPLDHDRIKVLDDPATVIAQVALPAAEKGESETADEDDEVAVVAPTAKPKED